MIKSTIDMRAKKSKYNHRDILYTDIMNLEDTSPQYMPNISDNNFIKGVVKSMIGKLQSMQFSLTEYQQAIRESNC